MNPFEDKKKTIKIVIYLLCCLIELYVPCYFANRMTAQSESLADSIFHSKWWTQSKRYKLSILIFVQRASRPIQPMAGPFFNVGLPIFVNVRRDKKSVTIFFIRSFFFLRGCIDREKWLQNFCGDEKYGIMYTSEQNRMMAIA